MTLQLVAKDTTQLTLPGIGTPVLRGPAVCPACKGRKGTATFMHMTPKPTEYGSPKWKRLAKLSDADFNAAMEREVLGYCETWFAACRTCNGTGVIDELTARRLALAEEESNG